MRQIERRMSACPVPPVFSIQFRKAEDGEAHGIRVGDTVKFKTEVYGALNPWPVGQVVHIEILRENIGWGEETYARFYIRAPKSSTEIRGIDNIIELVA